ncbi:hypothetical protein NDGK_01755 [Clostridiales bacterium CHKCI001]|nr:hypothetical protein NDGK_01755 [Clostridiales bacterium CHKCI001]
MINTNWMMSQILLKEGEKQGLQAKMISKQVIKKTRLIRNCVIFDENGTLNEERMNFDRILKIVGAGYEVSSNELRFSEGEIPRNQILYFVDCLNLELSRKYGERKFGIIISLYDGSVDLRFHTYREKEGLWLDNNLDKYDVPILYSV